MTGANEQVQTAMDVKEQAILASLSRDRLGKYLSAANGDLVRALELYSWNTKLSGGLYGPLQGLEVVLRNAMNRELTLKHGPDWYKNTQPVLFGTQQGDRIAKALSRFDQNLTPILSDIVADLSFGFWSDILEYQQYDELWKTALHKAFPHRPKGTRRPNASLPVTKLYRLRNRIAHHEPIWKGNLATDYKSIIETAKWICPVTASWIDEQSDFKEILQSKPAWLQ